jgi:hypothetical protein
MQRKALRATVSGVDRDIPIGVFGAGQYLYFDGVQVTTAAASGGGSASSAALNLYVENETEAANMETGLRRTLDAVTAYTDETTLTSNTFPFTSQWPSGRKLLLSHSLMPSGGDMAAYAAGTFNATYQTCANNLIPYRARIQAIRIGWEFNAPNIYPWCAGGAGTNQTQANYKGAFQQFARILKNTLPEIPIDWCPLADNPLADPWYPGDAYVDVIGNDAYMNSAFWSDNFDNILFSFPNSLNWQEAFAAAHGKRMSWPEWATDYNTGTFVTKMAAWMKKPRQVQFAYHGYWDSDLGFTSAFATHAVNKTAYLAAFGV